MQEIKDMGTTYTIAENARDLGVDFSFSKNQKVRKNILKTRIKNSQGALNKIYKLAKISRRARVLFSGAGFSKATWGQQTSGLSMQEWTSGLSMQEGIGFLNHNPESCNINQLPIYKRQE